MLKKIIRYINSKPQKQQWWLYLIFKLIMLVIVLSGIAFLNLIIGNKFISNDKHKKLKKQSRI